MRILAGILLCCCLGCASTPAPLVEYTLARSAVLHAKRHQAAQYSPGFWVKANELFQEAEKEFKEENFSVAKSLFEKARALAERAENISRIKKMKGGGEEL